MHFSKYSLTGKNPEPDGSRFKKKQLVPLVNIAKEWANFTAKRVKEINFIVCISSILLDFVSES